MTGRPNHQIRAALFREVSHSFAQEQSRRDKKLVAWRLAEIAKFHPWPGAPHQDLVKAHRDAMNDLREVADSLIAKGHP